MSVRNLYIEKWVKSNFMQQAVSTESSIYNDSIDHSTNFICDEETTFYGDCIKDLVFNNSNKIIEFGTGDASGVIKAINEFNFKGKIIGYEINELSIDIARKNIKNNNLDNIYKIKTNDFFNEKFNKDYTLISNPPYIPAYDSDILMPNLFGGIDGNELSKKLIDQDFNKVMLLVSSYCDPSGFIDYCLAKKYQVTDFKILEIEFGYYSSESKVLKRINDMKNEGKAYFNDRSYILSGVLFEKQSNKKDLSDNLVLNLKNI